MKPERRVRQQLLVFFAAGLAQLLVLVATDASRGGVRIDETHKISETAFLGAALRADFSDSAWFCERVDRSNPPVGKYVLGTGLLVQGSGIPPLPTLAAPLGDDDWVPPLFDEASARPYLPLVPAARRVASALTALTSGMLALLVFVHAGRLAAIVAWFAFATSWMTLFYGATATFEPVLAFFIVLALACATLSTRIAGVSAGIACGLAIATRLSGGVALIGSGVLLLARREVPGRVRALGLVTLISATGLTAIVVDPFLWATAPSDSCAIESGLSNQPLLLRPLKRALLRVHDLTTLSHMLRGRGIDLPLAARPGFTIEQVAGDPAGLLLLLAATLGLLLIPVMQRGRELTVAVVATGGIYLAWLPFPWPRYVYMMIPLLSIAAGCGVATAAHWLRTRWTA